MRPTLTQLSVHYVFLVHLLNLCGGVACLQHIISFVHFELGENAFHLLVCLKRLCWLNLPGPFLELFDFHITLIYFRLHGQSSSLLVGSKIDAVDIVSSDFRVGAWFHLIMDAELNDHEDSD